MVSLKFLVFFLFFSSLTPAQLGPNWGKCIDQAELSLEAGLGTKLQAKITKKYCKVKFVAFGIKGEKFEVDVCRTPVQLDYYPQIDETNPRNVLAISGNCNNPLFGIDTDSDSAEEGIRFEKYRKRIWELLTTIEQTFGTVDDKKLASIENFAASSTDFKLACAKQLLQEYLNRCKVFEASSLEQMESAAKSPPAYLPPGVHPATIKLEPKENK